MSTTDPTINIPQLILVVAVTIFVVRYLFFSSGDGSPGDTAAAARGGGASSSAAANGGGNRAREADVERVQQMFPQIARRDIMWDLQRNGGNVVATTERVLSGRGLEMVSLCCGVLCCGGRGFFLGRSGWREGERYG